MAEGTGTGVPEPHQEIEDEPSILDTNFDLTSQAGGEEGQIATPSTRQSQVGIVNTGLFQTSLSEGTGEPEPHQEIEDEPSIHDTNIDLTSQASGGEEGQIATPSTRQSQVGIVNTGLFQTSSSEGGGEIVIPNTESQVGIANPNIHQATPSEVVVAGGDFKNVNFGPHTSTSHFEARNYVNQTFNYNFHSATNQSDKEPSTSAAKRGDATKAQSEELQEGYIRISDDTVMYNVAPIREGANVYEGYQEHVSEDGSLKKLPVAIKRIIPSTPKHRAEVQHLLTLASHPNIIRIIRSKEHKTQFVNVLFIVMELCSLQNLNDYLKENRENSIPFDFKKTLKFTKQLVKGMKHIHDSRIIHRDVKPENILLSTDKTQLKFTDFGIGKKLRQGGTSTKVTVRGQGTTGYMAPETHFIDKVSKSGDIFSLGVTLSELWSNGLNPYGLDISLRDFNIKTNKNPDFSGLLIAGPLGNALLDLIKRMLQHDPRLRPTIDEVQKDIFFINAKMKSGEELLSSLNLGTWTPSDVESVRKQSVARIEIKLQRASNANQQERSGSSIPKEIAARTEEKQPTVSGVTQPERTGSTFPKEIETVDALMEDSKFKEAMDLLERLPQTQDQQIKLLKCYVQLGRISEVLKCIKNMRKLVTRNPRPKAAEVYKLGLDNFEKSSLINAIAYFACAAKIYSFELDADEAVRSMRVCSFKSYKAVAAMIKQNERMRLFARGVGMEIMNSIYCDVTEVSNANPDLKAKVEACCLYNTGTCYDDLELYEKMIEVNKRGVDIMNRQFGENSSKYEFFGHLLNNMGFANEYLGNYSEAESLYERSINAYERAEDWEDDEAKKEMIEETENSLRNIRRQKK